MRISPDTQRFLQQTTPKASAFLFSEFRNRIANAPRLVEAYQAIIGEVRTPMIRQALSWGTEPDILFVPDAYGAVVSAATSGPNTSASDMAMRRSGFACGVASVKLPHVIVVDFAMVATHEAGQGWEVGRCGMVPLLEATILHELAHWLWHRSMPGDEPDEMGFFLERLYYFGDDHVNPTEQRSSRLLSIARAATNRPYWE